MKLTEQEAENSYTMDKGDFIKAVMIPPVEVKTKKAPADLRLYAGMVYDRCLKCYDHHFLEEVMCRACKEVNNGD